MVVSRTFDAKAVAFAEDKKAGKARLHAFLIPSPHIATAQRVSAPLRVPFCFSTQHKNEQQQLQAPLA